ncbi:hypothetical protein [Kordiimonas lacus]|uniref:Uncharacterized protein n=1 Tax=Kordiimonas lacus TaxID=637679 RepID=A0A1G6XMA1_9PROT|nr:hypothetical protein [Kordiimonas lacus]SDD78545.1 hypothetical protein SAMN04488071_1269 [Kordiimonas lacus]
MKDQQIKIFETGAVMRAVPTQDGINLSIILEDGTSYPRILHYLQAEEILDGDLEAIYSLLLSCYRPSGILRILNVVSHSIIWVFRSILGVFRFIFGSFIGFGAFGFLLLLGLGIILMGLSLYGLIFTLPFFLIAFGLQKLNERIVVNELKSIQKSARQLCQEVMTGNAEVRFVR